jgi:hypothetical protein
MRERRRNIHMFIIIMTMKSSEDKKQGTKLEKQDKKRVIYCSRAISKLG